MRVATPPGAPSCATSPRAGPKQFASKTWSRGLAATSSLSCWRTWDSNPAAAVKAALTRVERVRAALTEEIDIGGQPYQSSGSIGIALPVRPGHAVADLLREADTAMYHAKSAGRDGVAMFESDMLADAESTLTLERDLSNALPNNELALHLQLQVDHDRTSIGADARTERSCRRTCSFQSPKPPA